MKTYWAEFFGTFWLVLGGCGAAMLSAGFPAVGIGLIGVSLAFGLTVLTMAYSIGHVSGAHLNPAVTIGFWASGRLEAKRILPYIGSQIIGAITAACCFVYYRYRQRKHNWRFCRKWVWGTFPRQIQHDWRQLLLNSL
jgi:aquaporin Z